MANCYKRWGWAVASLALLSICSVSTVTATAATTEASAWPTSHYGVTITFSNHDVAPLAVFDAVVIEKRIAREHPLPRSMALKVRASRQAVLPSSIAGWRSGRIKSLSS